MTWLIINSEFKKKKKKKLNAQIIQMSRNHQKQNFVKFTIHLYLLVPLLQQDETIVLHARCITGKT
jgi:hypothetical protein